MRTGHSSLRTIALSGALLVIASTGIVVLAAAQDKESCPPIIASLFPKGASNQAGQYFPGDLGQGKGSADVSYDDPICPKARFLARVSVDVKHYGGETAILIKSKDSPYGSIDRDADKARTVESAKSELAQIRLTPKAEKLGIGEIVYGERMTECPPEGPATTAARVGEIIVPNVKLKGVAWTDNARLEIELDGSISVELAKAAVAEVFANFQKADFSKAK